MWGHDGTAGRRDDRDRGRAAGQRYAWAEAFDALSRADRHAPLAAGDLELLATAAYLLGRVPECIDALRRAYESHLAAGAPRRAARAVFWMAFALSAQGDIAQAGGWLARASQLLEPEPPDCAEQGLPLLQHAHRQLMAGETAQARELAARAAEIGRGAGDADVRGLALTVHGGALVRQGHVEHGMALLDEAMVAVVAAEVSPLAAGTIYCSLISICQEMSELRRAQEWTGALTSWCERQPQMVTFTGQCLVHRAELLQLRGAWREAADEAQRACDRLANAADVFATGAARYRQGEIHRARGDLAAAEEAYRQASEWGYPPYPGLALLRLAQGHDDAARAAIRRALDETTDRLSRTKLLPAEVEIALVVGDVPAARLAAGELAATAGRYRTPGLRATADQARAAVLLADGNPAGALTTSRAAWALWRELDAPYEAARTRVVIARACRELGDVDAAQLELDAAASTFARLGAVPDQARVTTLSRDLSAPARRGLTRREMQVLRLVATGRTNHAIATELVLSEKTVDRHVSNILAKLGVSSRVAATAYAYQHRLL